jgi:stage V sporulation protein B
MISCAVQSFFQFLDTATIQYSLGKVSTDTLKSVYASALSLTSVSDGDLTTYVYGLFSSALDFKNLIPGVTMALGVCAVPAVSGAMEMKNDERLSSLINSIYKYTVLLSSLGGIAMALCSTQILSLFYSASSPDIVEGCNDLVKYFSLTVPIYSIAGTAVFMVQAVGHPEKSIAPYVISGIVRVVLNVILVSNPSYILFGCVISGAVGYMIMCILNMHIVHKVTNTKLDIMSVLIKPIFVTICTAIASNYLFSQCNFTNSTIYNLLIKMSILVGIYCILCLLCGLLNLKEIFSTFKKQKNS